MLLSLYTEKDLQELWERGRFRREGLLTEDARRLEVEFPGYRGGGSGPDFRGARLRFDGAPRIGDVELHLFPSGWDAHGHGRDGAYAGVILHVVLRRDRFAEPRRGLPLLVLEPYLPGAVAPLPEAGDEDLDALGEEWFAERRARAERALERGDAETLLYRGILTGLGWSRNAAAMAELARRRPLGSLAGDAAAIGRSLREAADGMPRELWRLAGIRPANHPWRRLEGMAAFLASARPPGLEAGLRARPELKAMTEWLSVEGIGAARAAEIALNVFVPFLGPEAWRGVAELPAPKALPGLVARPLSSRVSSVRRYFGALRAMKRRT